MKLQIKNQTVQGRDTNKLQGNGGQGVGIKKRSEGQEKIGRGGTGKVLR